MLLKMFGTTVAALAVSVTACAADGGKQTDKIYESEQATFQVKELASDLSMPWGLDFLPDGRMVVTEKTGQIRIYDPKQGLQPALEGLPEIAVYGQGGLLDVAVHPDYENNGWIYFSYSAEGEDKGTYGTEVARAKLKNGKLQQLETVFVALPKVEGGAHFGSRLVFDKEGYLYITLGDRGQRDPAQDLSNHIGSVIRLHDDGSIPEDNPFVNTKNVKPEIYSYGHRNIQGATLDPETNTLWTIEHGPQGGDELNKPQPGVNYGWPVITYGVNYGVGTKIGDGITEKEGMAQPLYYWVPSIAPSGLVFYTGDKFPQWRGDLIAGALKFQLLARMEMDGDKVTQEERLLKEEFGRIRAVEQGPDGFIYLLTDSPQGKLLRLEPAEASQ